MTWELAFTKVQKCRNLKVLSNVEIECLLRLVPEKVHCPCVLYPDLQLALYRYLLPSPCYLCKSQFTVRMIVVNFIV